MDRLNDIKKPILQLTFGLLVLQGCIEPFEAATLDFEGALVVDARLTNEARQHQVLLSRARPFEAEGAVPERGAVVTMLEDSGTSYAFEEVTPGQYVSTAVFGAQENRSYQLRITTANGSSYSSTTETMPENVPIADLEIRRETNDLGEDGVAVFLDNSSLGNQARYFRYDYEETYKIIAPNWDPFKFKVIDSIACSDGDAFEVTIEPKGSTDGRICYGKNASTEILLASTTNLENNDISDFRVRFVNRENYTLMHRYSILVNQYSQSVDAHSYYQSLQAFSVSESVFSDIQPGFLAGNIVSESDPNENVIGYFETAAVSSKRVFFNYEDLFPEEPLPDYPITCSRLGNPQLIPEGYHCTQPPNSVCDGNCESPLLSQIETNIIVFAGQKANDFLSPFYTLPRACGDCTVLGSKIKPDFWID